ncbi:MULTISPECIES: DinB family protein [Flavobacteriaceae]|uniref:DinB family protein n=1 Tax=Flavobacteriaceae TaxID=49546 RepID=UPI001492FAF4|nr:MULTISPECIES: DinB family protein [Allomuricauda]MDC6366073.1 DinB family protein [Muricauda sp. AC10]
MTLEQGIASLEQNRRVLLETLANIPLELVNWKKSSGDWSLLEIICHLVDEEKEDFRTRVEHTLKNPDKPLIPIDPAAWVKQRNYNGQDFKTKLQQFDHERQKSIAWLKSTFDLHWENVLHHPQRGPISAYSFLFNWLAHDYHHIRQINNIKYAFLKESSGDSLTYAGKW